MRKIYEKIENIIPNAKNVPNISPNMPLNNGNMIDVKFTQICYNVLESATGMKSSPSSFFYNYDDVADRIFSLATASGQIGIRILNGTFENGKYNRHLDMFAVNAHRFENVREISDFLEQMSKSSSYDIAVLQEKFAAFLNENGLMLPKSKKLKGVISETWPSAMATF